MPKQIHLLVAMLVLAVASAALARPVTIRLNDLHVSDETDALTHDEPWIGVEGFRARLMNVRGGYAVDPASVRVNDLSCDHDNIRPQTNWTREGRTFPIPTIVGSISDSVDDGLATWVVGAIVLLLDEDDTPDTGAGAICNFMRTAVRAALTEVQTARFDDVFGAFARAMRGQFNGSTFAPLFHGRNPDDLGGVGIVLTRVGYGHEAEVVSGDVLALAEAVPMPPATPGPAGRVELTLAYPMRRPPGFSRFGGRYQLHGSVASPLVSGHGVTVQLDRLVAVSSDACNGRMDFFGSIEISNGATGFDRFGVVEGNDVRNLNARVDTVSDPFVDSVDARIQVRDEDDWLCGGGDDDVDIDPTPGRTDVHLRIGLGNGEVRLLNTDGSLGTVVGRSGVPFTLGGTSGREVARADLTVSVR